MNNANTGQTGVHIAGLKFSKELRWLFREQPIGDYGIDALIEELEDGAPTGKLIAAQIKTGVSYFKERTETAIVFRGEQKHLNYWLGHQLPVILILVDDVAEVAYWQRVSEDTVERTEKGWKMLVPASQRIEAAQANALKQLFKGSPNAQRFVALQLDRPWMELLKGGKHLFVEADQWVNKTSGRCGIELVIQDDDGREESAGYWNYYVFYPGHSFPNALQLLFPWATFAIDGDKYFWEEDENELEIERPSMRPYSDDGEVASWRLELFLNELGEAFLKVDAFLQEGLVIEEDDN